MSLGGRGAHGERIRDPGTQSRRLMGTFSEALLVVEMGHREGEQLSPPSPVLLLRKGQDNCRGTGFG